jgi:hypothetical protein
MLTENSVNNMHKFALSELYEVAMNIYEDKAIVLFLSQTALGAHWH